MNTWKAISRWQLPVAIRVLISTGERAMGDRDNEDKEIAAIEKAIKRWKAAYKAYRKAVKAGLDSLSKPDRTKYDDGKTNAKLISDASKTAADAGHPDDAAKLQGVAKKLDQDTWDIALAAMPIAAKTAIQDASKEIEAARKEFDAALKEYLEDD
jgi:tetratricopeptide (TPR) repeat protein